MHVKVRHLLAGIETGVRKQPITVLDQSGSTRNMAHRPNESDDFGIGSAGRKVVPRDVRSLRNHKNMGRGQGVNIVKCECELILIDLPRRNFTAMRSAM